MLTYLKNLLIAGGTAGAFTSLGVVAGVIGLAAMGVNIVFGSGGEDIVTQVDQDTLKEALTTIVAKGVAVVALFTAIVARIRATKKIGGGSLQ